MDHGGTHVVIAGRRSLCMFVFFENDGIILFADPHHRRECVRFRNFVARLQEAAFILHREKLSRSVGTQGFDRRSLRHQDGAGCGSKPEARRHAVFKNFEQDGSGSGRDFMRLIMVMAFMRVSVTVMMMSATAQKPCARDIYCQAKTGDRDRFGKMNRDRSKNTTDGFIADQQRDHG